jgi:hypothetical protein
LAGPRTVNAIKSRWAGRDVTVVNDVRVDGIDADHVTISSIHGGPTRQVRSDLVVLVCHNESRHGLAEQLRAEGVEVHLVGDAVGPRFLQVAIAEGHRVGAAI